MIVMIPIGHILMVLVPLCAFPDADKPQTLRYLRPAGDKFVLESELSISATTYVSLTNRVAQRMTLTLRRTKNGPITEAEAILETKESKQRVVLQLEGRKGRLTRDGKVEELDTPADPVVTTAPDWSDIFLLVHRYDADKGGAQEFPGLWIHPTKDTLKLTFTIEHVGQDTIRAMDKPLKLDRYRIRLRSGNYLAWADRARTVYKLMPANPKSAPVVLEGFEESTRGLGP